MLRNVARGARHEERANNSSPCVLPSLTVVLCNRQNAGNSAVPCHDGGTLLLQQVSAGLIIEQCAVGCSACCRDEKHL